MAWVKSVISGVFGAMIRIIICTAHEIRFCPHHHNIYLIDVLLFLSVLGLLYILKNIMTLILYYFLPIKQKFIIFLFH